MDKILHISIVLLGILWLVSDLYGLETNKTSNFGASDFYFIYPYSSNKSNAPLSNSTTPYIVEATRPSTLTRTTTDVPRNNQQLPDNTDPNDLRKFLQFLLSAFNLLNTGEEKPKGENPEIKNNNPADNQTERTIDMNPGNSDVNDDIEFENFSGDNDNYDDEDYYEDDNKKPSPLNDNLRKPNPDSELRNPAGVTENYPINNFYFNRFSSSPNTHIPQVKTEQNEAGFIYNYRNIPTESSVNQLQNGRPIDPLIPPNVETKMYDTFIPYPFQRNIPESGFALEYVPFPNLFANSYLARNQFVNTRSNFPLDKNVNQQTAGSLNIPQTPTITRHGEVFDPYIQYNQRYVPNISYLSEYIPISSNQSPERNENISNATSSPLQKVSEPQNPIANFSRQYNPLPETNLEPSKTTPSNNPNANITYNIQPISAYYRNPTPIVSITAYIQKNKNSPQKNESEKFPSVPNTVYAKPEIGQSPLPSLQNETKPLNISEVKSILIQLIRTITPNSTDNYAKIPGERPKLDNATLSNFTVPDQPQQQPILNNVNSSVPVQNSTVVPDIKPTSQQKTIFVTEQTILNQTLGNSSNSDGFPKNQSLPAVNPFYLKGDVPQFNISDILFPQINNTNGNSTASPQNNATEVNGERTVSRNSPANEQQAMKPIPLKIQFFPFSNLSVPEPEKPYQPDFYPYEDYPYDEDEALNELLHLLELMQEMMNNATAQIPQNTSDSTTSTIIPPTPGNNKTIQVIPQNVSAPYMNSSVIGLFNPVNSSETPEYFKPIETFGSMLEYIFKYSNNSLFTSLRSLGNVTAQN